MYWTNLAGNQFYQVKPKLADENLPLDRIPHHNGVLDSRATASGHGVRRTRDSDLGAEGWEPLGSGDPVTVLGAGDPVPRAYYGRGVPAQTAWLQLIFWCGCCGAVGDGSVVDEVWGCRGLL